MHEDGRPFKRQKSGDDEATVPGERPVSMYISAFQDILDTVLAGESHLFDTRERGIIDAFIGLPYEARYVYVRLFMRKAGHWFRVNKLAYSRDVGDMLAACQTLCRAGLADDAADEGLTCREALSLLSLDELKELGRQCNCKTGNKETLVAGLARTASQQSSIRFGHSSLVIRDKENRNPGSHAMISRVLAITGELVRLRQSITELFHRIHIVFYRTTDYDTHSMTSYILARISRRAFPRYRIDRSSHVFQSRNHLVRYEAMIKLKSTVDEILESNAKQDGLQRVLEIFESIYDDWKLEIAMELSAEDSVENEMRQSYYLRRFTPCWVMTRLVFKGAYVLGRFHRYEDEHEVLTTLLVQRAYRKGRRGEWYDRKALIEQHYMWRKQPDRQRYWKQRALQTAHDGLCDPYTHVIYHDALQRRISRLERDLRIAKKDQHDFAHVVLLKPTKRVFTGRRMSAPEVGRHIAFEDPKNSSMTCSVEQLCLSSYEALGWTGVHSENSIMTTMFGLLFWDILFMDVPGVFETGFQTAPLDLTTDAFYPMRAREIEERLSELEAGKARDILSRVDGAERLNETWCIGVNWEYSLDCLCEVAECLGGRALSHICRHYAEEYSHRTGGLPDLCLWRMDERRCMFVEVKSVNDRLSDTQKLWLDVLSRAGVPVELCRVDEIQAYTNAPLSVVDMLKVPS